MDRMRGQQRPEALEAAREDVRGLIAAETGVLVFLIGLALLFVANAPS